MTGQAPTYRIAHGAYEAEIASFGGGIKSLTFAAEPLVAGRSPCQWCDYGFVCCHETGIGERALEAPAKPFEAPGQPEEGEEEQA